MDRLCILKPVLRVSGFLSLAGVIVLTGCGKRSPHSVEHAEVSGKVLFKGKPLPGGRIAFNSVNGSFAANDIIDENGNYKISAPVGEVKIGVDNTMLMMQSKAKGVPKNFPRPPGKEEEARPVKGTFVPLPPNFKDPTTSGLTYTVKPGPQTHDIDLSTSAGGAPSGDSGP